MRECVIVGRPNCGKTMFALNFAKYLGGKNVEITTKNPDGFLNCRNFSIEEAKRELCSMVVHKTRSLQSIALKMTVGKTAVNFKLTDTCGVSEEIHSDETIRKAMAQTIGLIRTAHFIIHIVDLLAITKGYGDQNNLKHSVDYEFYNYGFCRNAYMLLANKIDLPLARENFPRLLTAFPQAKIVPVSALCGQGFGEVKNRVARNI